MCMMSKYSALLTIGVALLGALFVVDLGHAAQTESRQDARHLLMVADMNGTANAPATQVSNRPDPCTVGAKGRTRATCGKQSQSESGEKATVQSEYLSAIITATVTVMLSVLIVLAALSLALIALATWSRRTPHPPLEKVRINLSSIGQGQRASWWARRPSLDNTVSAD